MQLKEMMDEICSRWSLPKDYIEFLFNHENNLYVNVDDDDDEDLSYEIEIYGAKGLLVGQHGYSYNPMQKTVIEDWNPNYVVIANCNADPYCIDILLYIMRFMAKASGNLKRIVNLWKCFLNFWEYDRNSNITTNSSL